MEAHSAKLSSKSQITIPGWARRAIGIGPGDRVAMRVEGETLVLEPVSASIGRLRGAHKHLYRDIDVDEMIRAGREDGA